MILRALLATAIMLQPTMLWAAPGGALKTLERGTYECALPGLAGAAPVRVQEERGFRVINSSRYRKNGERGTYLHTGDRIVFTSGSMRGTKFERRSDYMLQELNDDGSLGPMRCVRRGE